MVIRELVAKISYQLNKSSIKAADASINKTKSDMNKMGNASNSALSKIVNVASVVSSKIRSIGSNAQYSSEQLRKMGAFQDKAGRWHSSNGQYLKINADTSGALSGIGNLRSGLNGLVGAAGAVGKAFAAAFAVEKIIEFSTEIRKTADEVMNLDGRLRTITNSDNDRYTIEDNLYKLSQNNRQEMTKLGNLYFKVRSGTQKYGFSADDAMRATDIVSKSLTIGGASTAESNSTILQLGQALGSGFLMGDELNSLNENAQPLMRKIAEYFGKDIGELKEMGSQRELKSEDIMKAILSAGKAIDGEFGKMPVTIGQAMTKAGNSFDRFIQVVQRKTNVFGTIADFISNQVDYISNSMETAFSVFDKLSNAGSGIGGLKELEQLQQEHPILVSLYNAWQELGNGIDYVKSELSPLVDYWKNNAAILLPTMQQARDVVRDIGSVAVPIFRDIGWVITNLVTKIALFNQEHPGILKMAVEFLVVFFVIKRILGILSIVTKVMGFFSKNGLKNGLGSTLQAGATNGASSFSPLFNIIKSIIGLIERIFSALGAGIIKVAPAIAGLIAAIIPILSNIMPYFSAIVDGIITGINLIVDGIVWVINLVTEFAEAFPQLTEVLLIVGAVILTAIFAPWLLVIVAIGAVIAIAIALWDTLVSLWDSFWEKAGSAIDGVKKFFSDLKDYAISVITEIGNAIQSWIMDKIQWAQEKLDGLKSFADGVIDGISSNVNNAYASYSQHNNFNVNSSEEAATITTKIMFPGLYR